MLSLDDILLFNLFHYILTYLAMRVLTLFSMSILRITITRHADKTGANVGMESS